MKKILGLIIAAITTLPFVTAGPLDPIVNIFKDVFSELQGPNQDLYIKIFIFFLIYSLLWLGTFFLSRPDFKGARVVLVTVLSLMISIFAPIDLFIVGFTLWGWISALALLILGVLIVLYFAIVKIPDALGGFKGLLIGLIGLVLASLLAYGVGVGLDVFDLPPSDTEKLEEGTTAVAGLITTGSFIKILFASAAVLGIGRATGIGPGAITGPIKNAVAWGRRGFKKDMESGRGSFGDDFGSTNVNTNLGDIEEGPDKQVIDDYQNVERESTEERKAISAEQALAKDESYRERTIYQKVFSIIRFLRRLHNRQEILPRHRELIVSYIDGSRSELQKLHSDTVRMSQYLKVIDEKYLKIQDDAEKLSRQFKRRTDKYLDLYNKLKKAYETKQASGVALTDEEKKKIAYVENAIKNYGQIYPKRLEHLFKKSVAELKDLLANKEFFQNLLKLEVSLSALFNAARSAILETDAEKQQDLSKLIEMFEGLVRLMRMHHKDLTNIDNILQRVEQISRQMDMITKDQIENAKAPGEEAK